MRDIVFFADITNKEFEVYFEPIVDSFNIAPFQGGVCSMNDVDTISVLDEYSRRFEDAWGELADH